MSTESDLLELVKVAEETGMVLERRRIQLLISALPPATNDEWLFQMRVLRAITTPQAEAGTSRLVLVDPASASVAAAGVPEGKR